VSYSPSRRKTAAQVLFFFSLALALFVPTILLIALGLQAIVALGLGEWGDFLAGAFGPAALFMLAAGFLLQQQELIDTRKELEAQKEEMRRAANEAQVQTKILEAQYFINEWNSTKEALLLELLTLRPPLSQCGLSMHIDQKYETLTVGCYQLFSDISPLQKAYLAEAFSHIESIFTIAAQNYIALVKRFIEIHQLVDSDTKPRHTFTKEEFIAKVLASLLTEGQNLRRKS
jgi:hypothetical protein